jgi:hypothetical protein
MRHLHVVKADRGSSNREDEGPTDYTAWVGFFTDATVDRSAMVRPKADCKSVGGKDSGTR